MEHLAQLTALLKILGAGAGSAFTVLLGLYLYLNFRYKVLAKEIETLSTRFDESLKAMEVLKSLYVTREAFEATLNAQEKLISLQLSQIVKDISEIKGSIRKINGHLK